MPAHRHSPPLTRTPEQMIADVRGGEADARDELLYWVYDEALDYFRRCLPREQLLSEQEAEDLAGDCVLEFHRVMLRVRQPSHYARRMFRNNLIRYLRRKRRRVSRESNDLEPLALNPDAPEANTASAHSLNQDSISYGCDLSDPDQRKVETAQEWIGNSDADMQRLIAYRLADEPLPYRLIGEIVGSTETALRMKMTRFCRSVRREYARREKRRAWRMPDRAAMKR